MSAPERPKLSDLLAKVSAQTTAGNRLNAAASCAFELACQRFAATFFETYSYERAYIAVHPQCKLEGRKTKLRAAAYLDKNTRRGKRTVEILTEMWRPVEQVGIDIRVLVDWIIEPFTIDRSRFFRIDDNGHIEVHVQKNLTQAEWRAIKRARSRTVERTAKDGTVTRIVQSELDLFDHTRGVDQAIALLALQQRIKDGGDTTNPLPDELTKVLEAASRNRTKFLERLPPSRVRPIIEGQVGPAS